MRASDLMPKALSRRTLKRKLPLQKPAWPTRSLKEASRFSSSTPLYFVSILGLMAPKIKPIGSRLARSDFLVHNSNSTDARAKRQDRWPCLFAAHRDT